MNYYYVGKPSNTKHPDLELPYLCHNQKPRWSQSLKNQIKPIHGLMLLNPYPTGSPRTASGQ